MSQWIWKRVMNVWISEEVKRVEWRSDFNKWKGCKVNNEGGEWTNGKICEWKNKQRFIKGSSEGGNEQSCVPTFECARVFAKLRLHLPFPMCIQLSRTRRVDSFPIFWPFLSHCESISPSLHCSRIWQLWDYNETTASWSHARSKAVTSIVCCVLWATTRSSSTHHFLPLLYSSRL